MYPTGSACTVGQCRIVGAVYHRTINLGYSLLSWRDIFLTLSLSEKNNFLDYEEKVA